MEPILFSLFSLPFGAYHAVSKTNREADFKAGEELSLFFRKGLLIAFSTLRPMASKYIYRLHVRGSWCILGLPKN